MITPWGEFPVADAHVHFFSPQFFIRLSAQATLPPSSLGWDLPGGSPGDLAAQWAAELDRHGVEHAALIASIHGDEASVAAAVAAYPARFYGYFMLDPTQPGAVERIAGSGLQGLCLFPAMHCYSLHDDRLQPVFEAAARAHMVVFVHCGVLSVGIRKKLGLHSGFDLRYSNPVDLHAVALAFPEITFVVPHFGAGYFREALMLCDLCPNVYLDTSSSNSWMRFEGLTLTTVFRRALEILGPERLLFGTDSSYFPRGWNRPIFERQVAVMQELALPAAQARLILGENLARIMR